MLSAVLKVEWILRSGNFERPVAIGQFRYMQHNPRAGFHVRAELLEQHAAASPAKRVGVHGCHMQWRSVSPRRWNVGVRSVNRAAIGKWRRCNVDVRYRHSLSL